MGQPSAPRAVLRIGRNIVSQLRLFAPHCSEPVTAFAVLRKPWNFLVEIRQMKGARESSVACL
jgi:hypothetical protein